MSQRIRRNLAAIGLLTALFLVLPAPSRAAGLWNPAAAAGVTARVWSWLEGLGLTPSKPAARRLEKSGGTIDGTSSTTTPPATTTSDQGSGIDPNGVK
ncbi:MAG TPA: hypothetical protein VHC97_07760 [Thermoanaerobaculia bacterium]|jgi:hypothetical protein|nr:hypothetical protein [Thermoanaerobaculia bacterium]